MQTTEHPASAESIKAHAQGRHAYKAGLSEAQNPHDAVAYRYTDEGIRRVSWDRGFALERFLSGCPQERRKDSATSFAALAYREALRTGAPVNPELAYRLGPATCSD